jgi:hypothetical protein
MPTNPYQPPKEVGSARPRKPVLSVMFCASFAVGGALIGASFIAPFLPFFPGDPGGRSIGAGIGGFIGLAVGLGFYLLWR